MKKEKSGCSGPFITFIILFALMIILQEVWPPTIPDLKERLDTANKIATYGWIATIGIPLVMLIGNVIKGQRFNNTDNTSIQREEGYWANEIHSLVTSCYNETTHEFDWNHYWHEYTDLLEETPQRKAYLESELRTVSYRQINYIRMNLYEEEPDYAKDFINNLSWTIIENLPTLYGSGNPIVIQAKKLLSDIKLSKTSCSTENVHRLKALLQQL